MLYIIDKILFWLEWIGNEISFAISYSIIIYILDFFGVNQYIERRFKNHKKLKYSCYIYPLVVRFLGINLLWSCWLEGFDNFMLNIFGLKSLLISMLLSIGSLPFFGWKICYINFNIPRYIWFLIKNISISSIEVMGITVFNRKASQRIVKTSRLSNLPLLQRILLCNSVTMTPGTVVIEGDSEDEEIKIHSLKKENTSSILKKGINKIVRFRSIKD